MRGPGGRPHGPWASGERRRNPSVLPARTVPETRPQRARGERLQVLEPPGRSAEEWWVQEEDHAAGVDLGRDPTVSHT